MVAVNYGDANGPDGAGSPNFTANRTETEGTIIIPIDSMGEKDEVRVFYKGIDVGVFTAD